MSTAITAGSSLAACLRAEGFISRLVEPGDADYDRARAGWNGAVDRRPAAVAFARDGDDVAAAIRAARLADVPFTIRAGGHSVSGRSMRDGALCIDLRGLNAVEVDAEREMVRVGGGALLGELDAATQEHGLAVPAGQISHTGLGGLTLGGGIGWLMRRHGLTIDLLLAAEVVLADGRLVRASEDEHPELFWALRGGGGDFGAVTALEFRAHRVGPTILGGMLVYSWEQARDALRASRELMSGGPEELTLFAALVTAPPQEPFPPEVHGRPALAVAVAWSGDLAEGERVLAPLRTGSRPAADLVGPMPYVALQVKPHERGAGGRLVAEAREQLLGLLRTPLAQPQLGEHGQRQRGAAAPAPIRAGPERLEEDGLRAVPLARAHQHAAEDAAAPRLDRREAPPLGERDDLLAPLGGAVEVREAVADDERGAAGVAARHRVARLAPERDGHRLIEQPQALVDAPLPDDRPAELGERHALDVGVGQLVSDAERRARVPLRVAGIVRALGVLDLQPAELGHGGHAGEQALRARQPPGRRGVLAVDPVLAGQVGRHPAGAAVVAAAPVGGVGLAPAVDRLVALAQPPQRLAVAVEGLGIAGVLYERGRERVPRHGPVGVREVLPRGVHPRSLTVGAAALADR